MKYHLLMFLFMGPKDIPAALPVLMFLGTRLWSSSKTQEKEKSIFTPT